MNVRVFDDPESLSSAAAEEFVRFAGESIAARGRFAVALSGGSTPRRLYELLVGKPVAWDRVDFFWGDERPVPPDDKDSNYRMARETLLSKVNATRVHRLEAERKGAAEDYEKELKRVLGTGGALDLVLLGMGPDGHTASLFPGTAALREEKRWVVPNFVPKFGVERVTMTAPFLNRSKKVLFLVAGSDKAEALAEVLRGKRDPERLPSQLIEGAEWYVDQAAAARIRK